MTDTMIDASEHDLRRIRIRDARAADVIGAS
jgi:hypothetical protein